jgi:hypothetical protein
LIVELAPRWETAHEDELLLQRRGRSRRRAAGAGRRQDLVFVDRLLVTLAWLRLGVTHQVLAVMYKVDRSTVSRAIAEVRPLLARRGFTTPTGVRLRTLADVFAYAQAEGSGYALTAPRSKSADRKPTGPAGGRSCRVSANRTPIRRRWPATVKAACWGKAPTGQGACTTKPR